MLTHVVVVAGLLHQHFAVGWHVPHSLLHWAEAGGIAIAVVSTLAAALGEVLSMYKRHAKVGVGCGVCVGGEQAACKGVADRV